MATTLTYVLKHNIHSSILVMLFFGFILSERNKASRTVGPGARSCDGSNSCNSIYSPRHIFSAILAGMGGEIGPTATTFLDCGLSGSSEVSGVISENGGSQSLLAIGAFAAQLGPEHWLSPP